jgi:hypothetical protein
MKHLRFFVTLAILLMAMLACSVFSGGSSEAGPSSDGGGDPPPEAPMGSGSDKYDTEFPLPPKVENLTELSDEAINYQTSMPLTEVVEFYRGEFESAGYDERDITTVINDTTFSIVWDGHPSGKALVVQGVGLGDGMINVNVRLEE